MVVVGLQRSNGRCKNLIYICVQSISTFAAAPIMMQTNFNVCVNGHCCYFFLAKNSYESVYLISWAVIFCLKLISSLDMTRVYGDECKGSNSDSSIFLFFFLFWHILSHYFSIFWPRRKPTRILECFNSVLPYKHVLNPRPHCAHSINCGLIQTWHTTNTV